MINMLPPLLILNSNLSDETLAYCLKSCSVNIFENWKPYVSRCCHLIPKKKPLNSSQQEMRLLACHDNNEGCQIVIDKSSTQ